MELLQLLEELMELMKQMEPHGLLGQPPEPLLYSQQKLVPLGRQEHLVLLCL